jgi:Predicted nucleoside-diphosphate sugar epimerases
MYQLKNKRILVTGACGTVGTALIAELLKPEYGISQLVGVDNNETGIFSIDQQYLADSRARFTIGDVRDAAS